MSVCIMPSHHMNHIATYHVQTQQVPKLQTCFKASYWTNPAALLIPTVRSWLFKKDIAALGHFGSLGSFHEGRVKFYWEIEYQQQFWHQSGLESGLCMGLCFGERISIRKSCQKQPLNRLTIDITPATQSGAAPRATNGDQARHQSQPSATSATPATRKADRCRQVPRLPRKTKVDVTK